MKILSVSVYNFGSYERLEFVFSSRGLVLISGPTGSGKSTLCDIIPWILYGRTSKNGSVDEVRSWNTANPTTGAITLLINDRTVQVGRARKPNDLIIWEEGGAYRGKDLADTQRIINNLIGMDAETYITASYLHEFSPTSGFFTATAKARKLLTEQLVDLSLAKTLNENASEYKKTVKKERETMVQNVQLLRGKLETTTQHHEEQKRLAAAWIEQNKKQINIALKQSDAFETNKSKAIYDLTLEYQEDKIKLEAEILDAKSTLKPDSYFDEKRNNIETRLAKVESTLVCPTCGGSKNNHAKVVIAKEGFELKTEENDNRQVKIAIVTMENTLLRYRNNYDKGIKELEAGENKYMEQVEHLRALENPHTATISKLTAAKEILQKDISSLDTDIKAFAVELSDLESLLQVTDDFRALLVKNTIIELENSTNSLLTKHFDAEIRVVFIQAPDDKLEVEIYKDGNSASYTQLSKGQRQLLKLCFGVSVMHSVSMHSAVRIPAIFLDEPTDGLDEQFKVAAFGLLEDLSTRYDSVFCVEHNETIKSMFTNRIDVTLKNGWSEIEQAS